MNRWATRNKLAFRVLYTLLVLVIGGFMGSFVRVGESYDSCGCPNSSGFYVGIERHDELTPKEIFYWVRDETSSYKIANIYGGVTTNSATIRFVKVK